MRVPVVRIKVVMGVGMTGSVSMRMFMLVKRDFQFSVESIRYPAKRFEAGNMGAAFQPRNHGLGHAKPLGDLRLGFAGMFAKAQQHARTLCRNDISIVVFARFAESRHGCLSRFAMVT
jgi:hypothetical protein